MKPGKKHDSLNAVIKWRSLLISGDRALIKNHEFLKKNKKVGPNDSNIFPKAKEKSKCINSVSILRLGKVRYKIIVSYIWIILKVNNGPENSER